jgi:hypothetical protein
MMALVVIAKDKFPRVLVAPWRLRREAHETITRAGHQEGVKSGLSRLENAIGVPANGDTPSARSKAESEGSVRLDLRRRARA